MAMLFSHAEATERMVALPATADGGQKIDPEAARRACRLWLEALGVTRSRKSVHAFSQLRLVVARHRPDYVLSHLGAQNALQAARSRRVRW